MSTQVVAVDRAEIPALQMPDRFRYEVTYFIDVTDRPDHPRRDGEYFFVLNDVRRWMDDGAFEIVSPLDSQNKTEVELSEDHERFLQWLLDHQIERIRLT